MQFVSARDVREGMCVAQDVADPQGRTLIARGQRIGGHHIIRMRKFGIQSIFIDPNNGEGVVKPEKSELREKCQTVLRDSCSKLTQEFAAKRIVLDKAAIHEAVGSLLEALLKSKNPLITLTDISTGSDRLLQHSVNVTVLATVLAIDLHVPEAMLRDLATGMLFHDIGMIFYPENLAQKNQPPAPQEVAELRKHTQMGFEHLVRSDAVTTVAANVVLRHHETMDGTGYPQGMTADKLSPLMRIASVVEVYDSLTTARWGMPAVLPDVAISFILANTGKLFAKEVVVSLCKRVALYPVGSAVMLNSGEYGLVAGILPTAPTKPIVLIHFDNRGKQLKTPLIVELANDPGRCVARSAPSIEALIKTKEPLAPPRPVDPVLATL